MSGRRFLRRYESRALEPRPRPESLERLRRLGGALAPDDPLLADWFVRYRTQHLERLAFDLDLVEECVAPGTRLLEVGAVPLLATAALAELGYRVDAVDVAPQRFAGAIHELGLAVRRCDVEREPLPYPDASFDLVLCSEIFEHLRIDPIATFEEVLRVLRPGGALLLSTPNLRSLRGLRNLIVHHRAHAASGDVHAQYVKLRTLGHMGHVREYTVREVAEFLERVGFAVERVDWRGGHGRGAVGLLERLAPSLRPFFTLLARRPAAAPADQDTSR